MRSEVSILPKSYDAKSGMVQFKTGPIPGHPDYALKKDGSVVNVHPRILNKKERRRDSKAQAEFKDGYRFLCTCKATTFHYPSRTKVKLKGYEKPQEMETYKCAVCGEHFEREKIDRAVAEHAEREANKYKPKEVK